MIETKILAEVNNLRKDKKYRVATNESQNLTIRPELAGEARKSRLEETVERSLKYGEGKFIYSLTPS